MKSAKNLPARERIRDCAPGRSRDDGCKQVYTGVPPASTGGPGNAPGPLFFTGRRGYASRELTPKGVWQVTQRLGESVGVPGFRPHAVRHSAITQALSLTKDLVAVQRFARHQKAEVTLLYVDNYKDLGNAVAANVPDSLNGSEKGPDNKAEKDAPQC